MNSYRKFRVWCKTHGEWEKHQTLIDNTGYLYHVMYNDKLIYLKLENHIIQFSTGVVDKNGIKIFEGDILSVQEPNSNKWVGQIKWNHSGWSIQYKYIKDEEEHWGGRSLSYYCGAYANYIEVIGNICENNNLLSDI